MALENCLENNVSIPTTDNTLIKCNGEFIGEECVVFEESIPSLSITTGDTLKKALTNITLSLESLKTRIEILENNG